MFNRIAITTAALAVSLSAAAPSIAANSGSVTQQQYRGILVGETRADVHKALDTRGDVLSRGHNRYAERLWKLYGSGDTRAEVQYLKTGNGPFVVIESQWCTGVGTASMSCS